MDPRRLKADQGRVLTPHNVPPPLPHAHPTGSYQETQAHTPSPRPVAFHEAPAPVVPESVQEHNTPATAAPAVIPEPAPPAMPSPAAHHDLGKRLYAVSTNPSPGAIVIHCSDPRFQAAFEEFLEHELGLAKGGYIPIIVGGGAGVLGHPEQLPKEFKFLKERLEHYRQIFPTARRIILINHEGCRYYQNLKSRALAMIGSRLHMPRDLGRDDLSLVAEAFRHFLSHLGYSVEYYYAKFADLAQTHIEIEKVAA